MATYKEKYDETLRAFQKKNPKVEAVLDTTELTANWLQVARRKKKGK